MTSISIEIRNTTIIDGTKKPAYKGSIRIENDRIQEIVTDNDITPSDMIIDGSKLYTVPGFIDVHTHVDFGLYGSDFLLPMISQGVTTAIAMNCGLGIFPYNATIKKLYDKYSNFMGRLNFEHFDNVQAFLEWLQDQPKKINIANLIPHGNLHIETTGESIEQPSSAQMDEMADHLAEYLQNGFVGLSYGLIYPPGSYLPKNFLCFIA